MAISMYFGMTESGKSFLANKHSKLFKRVIIYDYANCFNDGDIFTNFDEKTILAVYKKYSQRKDFRLIFKPMGNQVEKNFNKVTWLSLCLGKNLKKTGESERLIFLTDEADFVCSANYQSDELKHLVNVGRHDHVDSWFIARTPQRIHTDIRDNASRIFCFKLINETSLGHLKKTMGNLATDKITKLEKYSFLAWRDSGEIKIFNKDGNETESL